MFVDRIDKIVDLKINGNIGGRHWCSLVEAKRHGVSFVFIDNCERLISRFERIELELYR